MAKAIIATRYLSRWSSRLPPSRVGCWSLVGASSTGGSWSGRRGPVRWGPGPGDRRRIRLVLVGGPVRAPCSGVVLVRGGARASSTSAVVRAVVLRAAWSYLRGWPPVGGGGPVRAGSGTRGGLGSAVLSRVPRIWVFLSGLRR